MRTERGTYQHPGVVTGALRGLDGSLKIADAGFNCWRDGLGEHQRGRKQRRPYDTVGHKVYCYRR